MHTSSPRLFSTPSSHGRYDSAFSVALLLVLFLCNSFERHGVGVSPRTVACTSRCRVDASSSGATATGGRLLRRAAGQGNLHRGAHVDPRLRVQHRIILPDPVHLLRHLHRPRRAQDGRALFPPSALFTLTVQVGHLRLATPCCAQVTLIIVASVVLDKVATLLNWLGYVVFSGGLCCFSYLTRAAETRPNPSTPFAKQALH